MFNEKEFTDKRESLVLELLKRHPEGLSIDEISAHIGVSQLTGGRILDRMVLKGLIVRRKIGTAKLHYHPSNFKGAGESDI